MIDYRFRIQFCKLRVRLNKRRSHLLPVPYSSGRQSSNPDIIKAARESVFFARVFRFFSSFILSFQRNRFPPKLKIGKVLAYNFACTSASFSDESVPIHESLMIPSLLISIKVGVPFR
jgi:hypothetical protein